jgi:hypothetical protein
MRRINILSGAGKRRMGKEIVNENKELGLRRINHTSII